MKLADEHWAYIKSLLEVHNVPEWVIHICGFHYKTAFEHGYKHAKEECDEKEEKREG